MALPELVEDSFTVLANKSRHADNDIAKRLSNNFPGNESRSRIPRNVLCWL